MLTRRTMLGGAAAASASFIGARKAAAQTATPLIAVIQLSGGGTYTYNQNNGTDLGNFVSTIGGFTQQCIRVDVSGFPLSVFFRPDLTSSRVEVVFELGRVFASGTPANFGAYTASIYQGGQLLATVNVPEHYWYSRWRWQSSPRPIVGNVAQLISQGFLPPYDTLGGNYVENAVQTCVAAPVNPSHPGRAPTCTTSEVETFVPSVTLAPVMTTFTPYTVMGLSDITPYMPQTGERMDIGLVTEPQAQYICTGSPVALGALRAWAEGASTVPWHIRDENTNAPINLQTYPNATWYWEPVGSPWIQTTSTPVTIDTAHEPALAYVPYILTGDPYHLEDLQFAANWDWGSGPPQYRPGISQQRAFAWYMRNLSQCALVTPASVPSWLLPQSYWQSFLQVNLQFLTASYVNNPSPVTSVFRSTSAINSNPDDGPTAPAGTWVDPWQDEYVASVMGWMLLMGFSNWETAYNWKIGSTIARTGTTSGWVQAWSTPYRMILRTTATSPLVSTWAEAWTMTDTVYLQGAAVTDTTDWAEGSDMTYLAYSRGSLAIANQLNVAGITANLAWATQQLTGAAFPLAYKWRLGSGL